MRPLVAERRIIGLALATLAAAWLARPVPAFVVMASAVGALMLRRYFLAVLTIALLASTMGARSWDGVVLERPSAAIEARARLIGDPKWLRGSVRVDLRLPDRRRVEASAIGDSASVLAAGLAGESVLVRGRLAPLPERRRQYLQRRHIAARLVVESAAHRRPGAPVSRFANQLRRTLVEGTQSLDPARRALFTGMVLGDDRDQEPAEVDDFRAAGMTHLLAVSGQNVAFVLVVASPLLRRLGLRSRFGAGAVLLLGFGILTRWEPSVLRAVAMAAISLLASTSGRPVSTLRVLALAVTCLVLVDPMLAGSLGFLLSAGACAGIAVIGPVLQARRVPAALAVTLAAQAGVSPLLIAVFGGVPIASVPANLLAVPAAGPLMVWGLIAGLPAGLLGGNTAALLHLPTRALLAWVAGVARVSASLPLPELDTRGMVTIAALITSTLSLRNHRAVIVPLGLAVGLTVAASSGAAPEEEGRELAPGIRIWRSGRATVVMVSGAVDERRLLTTLRQSEVRHIDVLVMRSGGGRGARLVDAARYRSRIRSVVAPPGNVVAGAISMRTGDRILAGPLEVVVVSSGPPLAVRVASIRHDRDRPEGVRRAPRARPPSVRRDYPRARDGHLEPDPGFVLRQGFVLRSRRAPAPRRAARRRGRRPARHRRSKGGAGGGGG